MSQRKAPAPEAVRAARSRSSFSRSSPATCWQMRTRANGRLPAPGVLGVPNGSRRKSSAPAARASVRAASASADDSTMMGVVVQHPWRRNARNRLQSSPQRRFASQKMTSGATWSIALSAVRAVGRGRQVEEPLHVVLDAFAHVGAVMDEQDARQFFDGRRHLER